MIVAKLKGGLGNQMFQYAIGRALSLNYRVPLGLDTSFYDMSSYPKRQYDLGVFNIAGKVLSKNEIPALQRLVQKSKFLQKIIKHGGTEKSFQFDPKIFLRGSDLYLDGYWQSPKYFTGLEDIIRRDFTLKGPLPENILVLGEEIKKTNSVCVHVRRGDYVGNKSHEVVTLEYYQKGIKYISEKTSIEKIYVFSDDIKWCQENFSFEMPTMFVDESFAGWAGEGHMFLMSQCKNFVIANSSFSWWAAWLSNYKNKIVVCPLQWFPDRSINTSDLIPQEWVRI